MKLFPLEYLKPFLLEDMIIENDTTETMELDFSQEMKLPMRIWKAFKHIQQKTWSLSEALILKLQVACVRICLDVCQTALALTFA